jgi:hypothetical protein
MHHPARSRPAARRALCVVGVATVSVISSASASFAAAAQDDPTGNSTNVATIGGMTIATLAWAVTGVVVLFIGLLAASKSGRRVATTSVGTARTALPGNAVAESSDLDQAALAS